MHSPFHPLLLKPTIGGPFLQLPSPHTNIIITPPRKSDAPSIPPILNDPRVYMNLVGPPFPHTRKNAEEWIARCISHSDNLFKELQTPEEGPRSPEGLKLINGCPVSIIREVKADGSDVYLGDLCVERARFSDVVDQSEASRPIEQNEAREIGEPDLVWGFGDYLAPSHHGQGIMSAAVKTMIEQWMIPRMGVRKMVVHALTGNPASVRVFEKNGFALTGTVENVRKHQESKGGQWVGLHTLERSFNDQEHEKEKK